MDKEKKRFKFKIPRRPVDRDVLESPKEDPRRKGLRISLSLSLSHSHSHSLSLLSSRIRVDISFFTFTSFLTSQMLTDMKEKLAEEEAQKEFTEWNFDLDARSLSRAL